MISDLITVYPYSLVTWLSCVGLIITFRITQNSEGVKKNVN